MIERLFPDKTLEPKKRRPLIDEPCSYSNCSIRASYFIKFEEKDSPFKTNAMYFYCAEHFDELDMNPGSLVSMASSKGLM